MKFKPTHLAILAAGVVSVLLLSLLPKFVVSDKEKRIKESENHVRQEVSKSQDHASNTIDSEIVSKLKKKIAEENGNSKLVWIDSLAKIYKNAFALDSAAELYLSFGKLDKSYYVMSIRDGLTGFQMTQETEKKRYYQELCDRIAIEGLKNYPDFLDLQVEQLRFQTLAAAFQGQAPMQFVSQLKLLVEENPNLTSGQIALAEFYTTVGKTDQAIERYLQVLKIDKNNVQAHLELVNLYLQSGKNISAKEHVARLQELNKDTKDSYVEDFVQQSLKKL